MEEVIKIIGIALIALIIIIIIKQYRPEFAIYISLVAGVIILALVIGNLTNVINLLKDISTRSGINNKFLGILLKMTGIAILTEFAISICKDAGENAIASGNWVEGYYNIFVCTNYFKLIRSNIKTYA